MRSLTLVTAPASEPVSLSEAKEHLRVDVNGDDALITSLIAAARQHGEEVETFRAFVTQSWALGLDAFPSGPIYLPRPPIQSVTSIEYVDTDGATQTLAPAKYRLNETARTITRAVGESWPATHDEPGAVTVTYVAGYGAPADVPEGIKAAIKIHVGDLYEHREGEVVGTSTSRMRSVVGSLYAGYSARGLA